MAHIPDGVLAWPVVAVGTVVAAAALGFALRRLDDRMIPKTAILAAAFFVVSLIAVPVGPSSVHLLLAGLMGLLLGPVAVLAVFVGLVLQALFFGFGGVTTLGLNTLNIAGPAILLAAVVRPLLPRLSIRGVVVAGALVGALASLSTGLMIVASLVASSSDFAVAAKIVALTYGPLAVVEGVVTASALAFIKRVRPEILASEPGLAPAPPTAEARA